MQKEIRRILIVRTDRIGDVILTLPMATVLKRHFPNARVSMLIRRYTSELVENNKDIEGIYYIDDEHGPISYLKLVKQIHSERFDVVFHTHPRFRFASLTWLARIPVRIGTGFRWYSFLFNKRVYEHRKDARFHELEYNLHLIGALGITPPPEYCEPHISIDDASRRRMDIFLKSKGVNDDEAIVILHPGSHGSSRSWSAARFGELARRFADQGEVRIVVTGGAGEEGIARIVSGYAGPRALELVNTFSLMEYAALAERASLFIANSTGTLHIAAAVGTPVIGFFPQHTSLSATRWGPYTLKKKTFTPGDASPTCRICTADSHPACECMDSIRVEDVYAASCEMLAPGSIFRNRRNAAIPNNSR